jgi:hypothetical protein
VADHFVLGGCSITSFDAAKGDQSVSDLLVERDQLRVAVEVYCPLTWDALEDFLSEMPAMVKNVDMPFDFEFEIDFEKINEITPGGSAAFLHPGELDAALSGGYGGQIVSDIEADLLAKLNDGPTEIRIERDEERANLRIRLSLRDITYNKDKLPERFGVMSGPERSGYRPEAIFETIVDNVVKKAKEGQALQVPNADAAVLVVDLSEADLISELRNEIYRDKIFFPLVQQKIGEERHGHTAIVFCDTAGWGKPFIPWFLAYDDDAPAELLDLLDPRGVMPRSATH